VSKPVRLGIVVLVLGALAFAGYKIVDKVQTASHRATVAHDLEDIAIAFKRYYDKTKDWARRPEDLQPHLERPDAFARVKDGQYIVVWDAFQREKPAGAAGVILAYEKDAPTKGGIVVYRDASFANLTAAEVQAALAAGKK
jgi:hypothetical protein